MYNALNFSVKIKENIYVNLFSKHTPQTETYHVKKKRKENEKGEIL